MWIAHLLVYVSVAGHFIPLVDQFVSKPAQTRSACFGQGRLVSTWIGVGRVKDTGRRPRVAGHRFTTETIPTVYRC